MASRWLEARADSPDLADVRQAENRYTKTESAVELINCLNQEAACAIWQMDIDFTGIAAQGDIIEVINLLNGAEAYDSWMNVEVDTEGEDCPRSNA